MIISVAEESLTRGLPELKPVLPRHYEELSLHQFHDFALNPNYDHYLERDARGEVLYVVARSGGALVGYWIGFIVPALHYQDCLTGTMDICYIIPEARGHRGGQLLFAEVERCARRRGVDVLWMGNKERARVHLTELYQRLGYVHEETYWCKWLEKL